VQPHTQKAAPPAGAISSDGPTRVDVPPSISAGWAGRATPG